MALNSKINTLIPGWIILISVVFTGYLIYWIPDFKLIFLALLVAELIVVIYFSYRFSLLQITLSRIILGCLFIFSGFVKGIDPVGTEYRIVDYFIAFGTDWAFPYASPLSVILNATEFVLGILLLFNVCSRITSWLVMLMMVFFTVITINDALNNPVPDCGCFGDVVKLTNWQTFYKNLVIDSLLLIVFFSRKRVKGWFVPVAEWAILVLAVSGFIWFEIYNIRHLPVIDFSDWRTGKNMINPNPKPVKYYLLYRNKTSGEEKEYLSPDYPYSDSSWLANWEFVSQRIDDPNPRLHDLKIEDENGNDFTSQIVENPGYQFILVSYDLSKVNLKCMNKIEDLIRDCNESNIGIAALTASLPEETASFKSSHNLQIDFYFADDIILKSMIRSNPGLLLMKNGVVLGKWHFNDFPTLGEINEKYNIRAD